ncbi:MAG: hypothetical protein WCK37_01945 [Candidatus Falkowbacteria bacterium]
MAEVQDIFNRIREKQGEQKILKDIHKSVLINSQEYQLVLEELKELKEKKKKIQSVLESDLKEEFDKIDEIKTYIASDKEMLSNMALSQIIKGEKIEITDEKNNKYGPILSVKFEKI